VIKNELGLIDERQCLYCRLYGFFFYFSFFQRPNVRKPPTAMAIVMMYPTIVKSCVQPNVHAVAIGHRLSIPSPVPGDVLHDGE